jgi:uncharacterized protein YbcI
MKTQGEIEAAISEGIGRFEQEYMGRGPKDIHAHLIGNFLIVRLQGVLTAAEQQLVKAFPPEKGRDLLKQVRTHLIETARPVMEAMIQDGPTCRSSVCTTTSALPPEKRLSALRWPGSPRSASRRDAKPNDECPFSQFPLHRIAQVQRSRTRVTEITCRQS